MESSEEVAGQIIESMVETAGIITFSKKEYPALRFSERLIGHTDPEAVIGVIAGYRPNEAADI